MSLQNIFLQEIKHELEKPQKLPHILYQKDVAALPALLQIYFEKAGFTGTPLASNFFINWENACLKLNPQKSWMQLDCKQFNAAYGPMRNALMSSKMLGLIPFKGKDKYQDGTGNMLIKLSAFTVSDSRGNEMNISALVTFLSEAILLPAALLADYIEWQEVGERMIYATITNGGTIAKGKFYFNADGLPYKFETEDRYYSTGDRHYHKYLWTAYYLNFKDTGGYYLPTELKATWLLPAGEYTYFTGRIKSITYNIQDITQITV